MNYDRDASHATVRRVDVFGLGCAIPASPASGTNRLARAWLLRLVHWCTLAAARNRQRHALGELDDRLLRDIGKTQREAEIEAAKPFWRA